MEEKNIVALEIGSSKIKGALGTVDNYGGLTINAVEEKPLVDSVRYGVVRNVANVVKTVREVLDRLETRTGEKKIQGVYLAVGGRSLGAVEMSVGKHFPNPTEIGADTVEELFADAYSQPVVDRKIIDVKPRTYIIDKIATTKPEGIIGQDIQGTVNVISCRENLIKTLNLVIADRLGLKIMDMVVRQIVQDDLVLNNEEKRQGCMVVDFGAETTTVSIYKGDVLQHLATLPLGSRNITRDITSLNILEERAEELKISSGNAMSGKETTTAGPTIMSGENFGEINNYVAARASEIIANIQQQIKEANLTPEKLPGGIILVGGGAKLQGFAEKLKAATRMKVRTALLPSSINIIDNRFAPRDLVDVTAILNYAALHSPLECLSTPTPKVVIPKPAPAPAPTANPYAPSESHEQATTNQPTTASHTSTQRGGSTQQRNIPDFGYEAGKTSQQENPKDKEKEKKGPSTAQRFGNWFMKKMANAVSEEDDDE